jgi:hypothetical protein
MNSLGFLELWQSPSRSFQQPSGSKRRIPNPEVHRILYFGRDGHEHFLHKDRRRFHAIPAAICFGKHWRGVLKKWSLGSTASWHHSFSSSSRRDLCWSNAQRCHLPTGGLVRSGASSVWSGRMFPHFECSRTPRTRCVRWPRISYAVECVAGTNWILRLDGCWSDWAVLSGTLEVAKSAIVRSPSLAQGVPPATVTDKDRRRQ